MEDLVNFEIGKKLKKKGFDLGCEWTYYNNYRVRNEIYDKHPGLSDDGYEDLRKKWGGPYSDDELYAYYIEPVRLYSRNSTIGINPMTKQKTATSELCSCPTIEQALKWLRKEKGIHVEFTACSYGYSYFVSKTPPDGTELHCSQVKWEGPNDGGAWDEYEPAALAAIEYILNNLI